MPLSDQRPGMDERISREKDVLIRNFETIIRHMEDTARSINHGDEAYKVMQKQVKAFKELKDAVEASFEAAGYE